VTRPTREDYEELGRLLDAAEEAVARVQGMTMSMFSMRDQENRPLPTRYEERAYEIQLALAKLRYELDLERRADLGEPE
jgi:hypothetical protein